MSVIDVKELDRIYEDAGPEGGLRVFMPCVHGGRTGGVAKSLHLTGNRLVLSAPSNVATVPFEYRYSAEQAKTSFGSNVSVFEDGDIFNNPPDVIVVGREDNERASIELWRRLSRKKPVVLCAYSGVFQSRFSWDQYRGVIACDLPSRAIARYHDVPSIKFQPVFATSDYPYQTYVFDKQFALRSFINGLSWRFPGAHELHTTCKRALESTFDNVLVENIEKLPLSEVKRLISVSAATLHIKDEEGFGWSILESLSTGRPIIAQSGLARNMAFNDWVIPGETAFFFKNTEDLITIVKGLIDDPDRLQLVQRQAADHLRKSFKPELYANELGSFLRDLWKAECARWIPGKPLASERRAISIYKPTIDPEVMQDYEIAIGEAAAMAEIPEPVAAGFTFKGKTLNPDEYGKSYLSSFRSVIDRFMRIKTGNVLEWGSGHTTRELLNALNQRSGARLFLTVDDNKEYLNAVTADLEQFRFLRPAHLSLTGPTQGQNDRGPNYSSYPLTLGQQFDFIFIDGRRRVECAYTAAILSHADTVVVIHDYHRDRYQSMLALFDVIEDGEQFRVMKIKPAMRAALDGALQRAADGFRST